MILDVQHLTGKVESKIFGKVEFFVQNKFKDLIKTSYVEIFEFFAHKLEEVYFFFRESYKHWPNKLPLGKKLKKLQKKFPKLAHKKSLTDKENGKILRNFDTLVTFFNEDPENGGRNR